MKILSEVGCEVGCDQKNGDQRLAGRRLAEKRLTGRNGSAEGGTRTPMGLSPPGP